MPIYGGDELEALQAGIDVTWVSFGIGHRLRLVTMIRISEGRFHTHRQLVVQALAAASSGKQNSAILDGESAPLGTVVAYDLSQNA